MVRLGPKMASEALNRNNSVMMGYLPHDSYGGSKAISGLTKCRINARLWHLNRKFQGSASISDFSKIIPSES